MKQQLIVLFSIVFISACFISCETGNKDSERLHRASKLMNTDPDSALILINAIEKPEKMREEERMYYFVQKVRAKYKNYQDVSKDTAIFKAKEFFDESKVSSYVKALAHYYCGCVHKDRNDMQEAMKLYVSALDMAERSGDTTIIKKINSQLGDLYYSQNIEDSALVHYKKAMEYFKSPEDDKWIMHACRFIALSYTVTQRIDSGLVYNRKGLETARNYNDSFYISMFQNNLGIIELQLKDYPEAKKSFLESLSFNTDTVFLITLYTNLSETYNKLNVKDSANYYAQLAEAELDPSEDDYLVHINLYNYLSKLKEEQGDYPKAYGYKKLWAKFREKEHAREKQKDFIEIERKYEMSKKEKELAEMKVREQFYFFAILFALSLIVISIITIKYVGAVNRRIKEKNAIQEHDLMIKRREIIFKERELETKDKEMKNMTFVINIYKKQTKQMNKFERDLEVVALSYSLKGKDINAIAGFEKIRASFEKMKVDAIENLHELAVDFIASLKVDKNKIEPLNTPDLLLMALLYCKYEHRDIANILSVNPHALQMRKQRLKNKLLNLGIPEETIDIFIT